MSTQPLGKSDDIDRAGERNRARNQALMREVNEQVSAFAATTSGDTVLVVCECADVGCSLPVPLTVVDYQRIRGAATHFIVKPGHELANGERIVELSDGYTVVEKLGEGAAVAARLDPRRTGDGGAGSNGASQ